MANLRRRALVLSYFTVGYNFVECALALLAGYLAGSIALVGFGLDSLVESISGGVMIWRFARREGVSAAEEERLERRAIKIVGYTFWVLAAYVCYESLQKLIFREIPAPSLLGILVALASLLVMPTLFYFKRGAGQAMNSASLMADAKQTLACAMLSAAVLVGLGLNYFWGIWQADPGIGLVIVVLLGREGYHTLKEKKLCSCATCGNLPPSDRD
jgi:divalent metal cation (Fe/Co/Zn/Cd) transporter